MNRSVIQAGGRLVHVRQGYRAPSFVRWRYEIFYTFFAKLVPVPASFVRWRYEIFDTFFAKYVQNTIRFAKIHSLCT